MPPTIECQFDPESELKLKVSRCVPQFFVFRTGQITFIAGCAALLMYAGYVGLMTKNDKLFALLDRRADTRIMI